MTQADAMEALLEYRRELLERIGGELVDIASEQAAPHHTYIKARIERLRLVDKVMAREDLIRGALERLK